MHASQPRHGQAKAASMDVWLQTNNIIVIQYGRRCEVCDIANNAKF